VHQKNLKIFEMDVAASVECLRGAELLQAAGNFSVGVEAEMVYPMRFP
jgi:hypothetical protein